MELNKELVRYIENKIFPLYNRNEEGHGINHIKNVIRRSLNIANNYQININMVYTIAAYHDLGHYIDRKKHEIISAEIFMKDNKIKQWFNDKEMRIIEEAIEDHRASNENKPRSIYGMIISTADRTIADIDDTIKRTYSYGKKNYPEISEKEQIEKIYEHLINKYGKDGYAKIYLKDEEMEEALERLRKALDNKSKFIERINKVIKEQK